MFEEFEEFERFEAFEEYAPNLCKPETFRTGIK